MAFDVDFSPIGKLARTYEDARTKALRERTLAELGQHFAGGDIDYRALGAKLFALGEPRYGIAALQAGELRDARSEALRRLNAPSAGAAPRANRPPPGRLPLAPGVWRDDSGFYVDPAWPGEYLKADS